MGLSLRHRLYMKSNNAAEEMWLRAETADEKLQQDIQTQDADGMQAVTVVLMTLFKAISQQYYIP